MEAAVVGLEMPDSYYREFGDHYAHMKEIFTGGMKELGIPFTDPEGTYFVLADIAPYMKKGQSDVEFCVEMAQKVGVACVPGSSFFDEDVNHIVRLHLPKGRNAAVCARPAEPPQADHVRLSVVYCVLLPIVQFLPIKLYRIIFKKLRVVIHTKLFSSLCAVKHIKFSIGPPLLHKISWYILSKKHMKFAPFFIYYKQYKCHEI